jgi:acyl-coenzyme A thioesterase PaaI-like protein
MKFQKSTPLSPARLRPKDAIDARADIEQKLATLAASIAKLDAEIADTGEIRAEGRVLNEGRRIGTAEGRVTPRSGRLPAHGTTTCLIFES